MKYKVCINYEDKPLEEFICESYFSTYTGAFGFEMYRDNGDRFFRYVKNFDYMDIERYSEDA